LNAVNEEMVTDFFMPMQKNILDFPQIFYEIKLTNGFVLI